MQYSADRLVCPAKRENNSKRPYLFVNPLQGKHIPADPAETLQMCRTLAEKVSTAWPEEKLYVIGFAETATGIAAGIGLFLENALYYQNTTRERGGTECLVFSESHSHAPEQLLRLPGMEEAVRATDRLIFIDDEVTTGNTICKLIRLIRERFGKEKKCGIVSILNSMTDERLRGIGTEGTECVYLARIPHEYGKDAILDVPFEPERHTTACGTGEGRFRISFDSPIDPRNTVRLADYLEANKTFAETVIRDLAEGPRAEKMLIAGTEEFMFPTIMTGRMILDRGLARSVRIHSTTRSPIIASGREGYPLFHRDRIRSPYDPERATYIYNLQQYDRAVVLTDAPEGAPGLGDLEAALRKAGNDAPLIAGWKLGEQR